MSGEVEKCQILHVRPKFDVFTLTVENLGSGLILQIIQRKLFLSIWASNVIPMNLDKNHLLHQFYWDFIFKGPRTVSYSICPNFDSLWLGQCIFDNYTFVLKSNPYT